MEPVRSKSPVTDDPTRTSITTKTSITSPSAEAEVRAVEQGVHSLVPIVWARDVVREDAAVAVRITGVGRQRLVAPYVEVHGEVGLVVLAGGEVAVRRV